MKAHHAATIALILGSYAVSIHLIGDIKFASVPAKPVGPHTQST